MNVYYDNEEDLKAKLAEAVYLLYRLRKSTKIWQEVYGAETKNEKKRVEEMSDAFLGRLIREDRELEKREKVTVIEKQNG
jgi:hypothetical protein